jgi:FAD-dependent oxidoreductase domain-containing protein 1
MVEDVFLKNHTMQQNAIAGSQNYDVVIAGGAVIGSAIAYELAKQSDRKLRILVLEPDPSYQFCASALSAGSIRQQFSTAINIDISLYGIRFLRDIGALLEVGGERPEIGLKEGGYLYIGGEDNVAVMREINALQTSRGADVALFEPSALAQRFPWLAAGDLALGSFGRTGEGWFDGYGLCQAFRRKARSMGVHYHQARATGTEGNGKTIAAVQTSEGMRIGCGALINAAGASGARSLASAMGISIPVYAKKRCVFHFSTPAKLEAFPLLIDTSGVWVRPEGQDFIAGFSPADLDETDHAKDFEVDWSLFEAVIWPALAKRVPAFEALRCGRAWAGHYDMCLPDHNALIGLLPGLDNGYLAAGFSGHGLQQSPAIGRGMAELVLHGAYRTLDLSPLSTERLGTGKWLHERNII